MFTFKRRYQLGTPTDDAHSAVVILAGIICIVDDDLAIIDFTTNILVFDH